MFAVRAVFSRLLDVAWPRQDDRNPVVAPLVGETFHFDLDGTFVVGRFVEVDPPHRMLLRWDRQATDSATSEPAFIEITLTPTEAGGTTVTITGTGFTGTTKVLFGAVAATSYTVVSSTKITAVSPAQAAGTHNIYVTTPGGTSAAVAADDFTYH
jgi:hypothetical protein